MNDRPAPDFPSGRSFSTEGATNFETLRAEFASDWQQNARPQLADYLRRVPAADRRRLLAELLVVEWRARRQRGEAFRWGDYESLFPDHVELIRQLAEQQFQQSTLPQPAELSGTDPGPSGTDDRAEPTLEVGKPLAAPPIRENQLGDYQLLAELGRGGMGLVYRARQISTNRIVALKLIRPDRLEHFGARERGHVLARFRTEVQATAKLEHDHVVPVFDVGEVAGQAYYAMRYIDGQSLRERVASGPLDPRDAARYVEQIARALAEAHAQGILHRDLKPHNIMIDSKTDRALLADFGLAKLEQGDQQLTASEAVFGSPSYMSPEQAVDAGKATAQSDLYGLGATLYHLLTGRPPFQAATAWETLSQVKLVEPVKPSQLNPGVPPDLETICLKCLSKEPEKRYPTAAMVAEEFARFLRGEPIQARPLGRLELAWRWCRRNPVVASLSAAAAVLVVAMLLTLLVSNVRIRGALAGQSSERQRAERALVDALTQQTQAEWLARKPGWRDAALAALKQAAALEQRPELGKLALQVLATADWSPAATHPLASSPLLLAVTERGDKLAVATADQLLVGELSAAGTLADPPRVVWEAPDQTRITRLRFGPDGQALAWLTDQGAVYLAPRIEAAPKVVRNASPSRPAYDVIFGPEKGQLCWSDGEQLQIYHVQQGLTVGAAQLNRFSPESLMRNNVEARHDPIAANDLSLLGDPRGEFVLAAGTTLKPILWRFSAQGITEVDLGRQMPSGANLHLAVSPDGRFVYLACNEPRWGEEQVGGRLPPWADDPISDPRNQGRTIETPGNPEEPEDQQAPGGAAGGESKEPPPPDAEAARRRPPVPEPSSLSAPPALSESSREQPSASQHFTASWAVAQLPAPQLPAPQVPASQVPAPQATGAQEPETANQFDAAPRSGTAGRPQYSGGAGDGGGFSKEPAPPSTSGTRQFRGGSVPLPPQQSAGGSGSAKEPAPPTSGSRQTANYLDNSRGLALSQAGNRPLSPVVSGPVRRIYLFQFEVTRSPQGDSQAGVSLRRIDPRTLDELCIFRLGDVADLTVSSRGEVILAGSTGEAVVLRPAPPRLEVINSLKLDTPPIRAAVSSGEGNRLIFASGQKTLHFWDYRGGAGSQLLRPRSPLGGDLAGRRMHPESLRSAWNKVAVSSAAGQLAVATWANQVQLRDLATGEVLDELSDTRYVRDLAWSPDGRRLEMLTPENQQALQLSPFAYVTTFAPDTRQLQTRQLPQPAVSVSLAHPRWAAYGLRNGGLALTELGTLAAPARAPAAIAPAPGDPAAGDQASPRRLAYDASRFLNPTIIQTVFDGARHCAAATSDGNLLLWSLPDFQPRGELCLNDNQERWINDLTFAGTRSGASRELAVATTDQRLVQVDATLTITRQIDVSSEILRLASDGSGQYLLCGGRDGRISLWSYPQLTPLAEWVGHMAPVSFVAFEADGKLLTAALDGEIRRWNLPELRRQVEALEIDWPTPMDFDWEPTERPVAQAPAAATASVVSLTDDLAELPHWKAFASDGRNCSARVEQRPLGLRTAALAFTSESGFATGVNLALGRPQPVDMSGSFAFWAYADTKNHWQDEQPVVTLEFAGGSMRYVPRATNFPPRRWTHFLIPLEGGEKWKRSQQGTPDPRRLRAIRIAHDVWDYGLRVTYDQVTFLPPGNQPPPAREDPRIESGRVAGDQVQLDYLVEHTMLIPREEQRNGKPVTVERAERIREQRSATFPLDQPLPDLEFIVVP